MSLPFRVIPIALTLGLYLPCTAAAQHDISVRLLDDSSPRQVVVSAVNGDVQLFSGDFADPLVTMTSDEEAIVSRASNQLHVKVGDMKLYAKSLRVEPLQDAHFSLTVREGIQLQDARAYFGNLLVAPDPGGWELHLTNEIDLEEYVAAVVSSEYGLDDLEGSKAMAVVARTYALSRLNNESAEEALSDHSLSQVYRGHADVTDLARKAVRETAGEVVTFDGSLIQAVYFSSSGGHTANNEDVWEADSLPYLRGKVDPYDTSSPHGRWTARLARSDVLSRLSETFQTGVEGFVIGEQSGDGRVATVELLQEDGRRQEVSGNAFRLAIIGQFGPRSLRSMLFDVRREGDLYVFEGRGYGHGVGLSQWGAHEMARQGLTYREILQFYYTGAQIESFDGSAPVAQPEPSVASRPEPVTPAPSTDRIGW